MTNVCSLCATENAPGAKFCRKCGSPLAAPPVSYTHLTLPTIYSV